MNNFILDNKETIENILEEYVLNNKIDLYGLLDEIQRVIFQEINETVNHHEVLSQIQKTLNKSFYECEKELFHVVSYLRDQKDKDYIKNNFTEDKLNLIYSYIDNNFKVNKKTLSKNKYKNISNDLIKNFNLNQEESEIITGMYLDKKIMNYEG